MQRIKRDTKGVSNIIVVALGLVIVVTIVVNVFLWNYEMNQLDYDKLKEDIAVVNVSSVTGENWTYNSSGYTLWGSTSWLSGAVSDLALNDGTCMTFRSYSSGTDTSDFVDNNLADVDSCSGKGTHSNFTAQQYGPDLIYDTLTEENMGESDSLLLYVDADDETRIDWVRVGANPYLDAIDYNTNYVSVSGNNELVGDFGFANSGKSSESINSVVVQIYAKQSGTNNPLAILIWDGSSWTSLGNIATPNSWSWMNWTATTLLNTWAKIDGAKIYIVTASAAGTYEVDCARLKVDYVASNYMLDLEVQWTNIDHDESNEYLCIYGGTMDAENIAVEAWNSSAWKPLLTDLSSGWNNISVSSHLTTSNFTIRFKGANETSDTTQDNWNIDSAMLHIWSDEYTSEVEFLGSSNTENWSQLNWTVDSAWTTGSVTVTLQLFNYVNDSYSTSGDGYIVYTSDNTPTTDEKKNQTITVNPTHHRNASGHWKIKIKGIKATDTQFDFKADWINFIVVEDAGTTFTFENKGSLTTHLVSLWVNNSTHHRRYNISIFVNAGDTESYIRSDISLPNKPYTVKIVTERGNIAIHSES